MSAPVPCSWSASAPLIYRARCRRRNPYDFLYNDGDDYYFMNTENYEQTT